MAIPKIRDILYFDLDKAASILSQFEWGLIDQISITQDESKNQSTGAELGIPQIAGINVEVDNQKKYSFFETKKLHHDILNRIEMQLTQAELVVDLSSSLKKDENSPDRIREVIGEKPYVKALGWSVIEDYQREMAIINHLNEIVGFINQSQMLSMKQSSEYIDLQTQIETKRQEINLIKDNNKKILEKTKLKTLESQLEKILVQAVESQGFEQWMIDGISKWIETFMPNRINFRIYPFDNVPTFQVLCNLKRDCFVDQNLEHLLYGYGNRPNVPLAVFGLITSIPPKEKKPFDPMAEFDNNNSQDVAFEKVFRQLFTLMEGFESQVRFSRYPNITIHPIAVFREFDFSSDVKSSS